MNHIKDLLKDPQHVPHRAKVFEQLKNAWYHRKKGNIFSYILRPIKSPLFDISAREIYQRRFKHLEYYPVVNTRVFSFGKQKSGREAIDAT